LFVEGLAQAGTEKPRDFEASMMTFSRRAISATASGFLDRLGRDHTAPWRLTWMTSLGAGVVTHLVVGIARFLPPRWDRGSHTSECRQTNR
jgi:hypothetical protein